MSDIHVDAVDGGDLEDGTSWGNAVKTLNRGMDLLSGTETLEARNGKNGHEFKEDVLIGLASKQGTLLNHTKFITNDRSIIDAESIRNVCLALDNVSFFDLVGWKFLNGKVHNLNFQNNAASVIVDNCIIQGATQDGIYANVCASHTYKNSIISYNTRRNISCGGAYTLIDNCSIHHAQRGIYELWGGANIFTNNEIYSCSQRGLFLQKTGKKEVNHNYIHNNALGVYVYSTCSDTCEIYFNDIHDNTTDTQDDKGVHWDKDSKGNYWGYGGAAFDSDGDAIGDDPHNIGGTAGSQDNFPLMCSYKIWPNCPYLGGGAKKHYWYRVGLNMRRF